MRPSFASKRVPTLILSVLVVAGLFVPAAGAVGEGRYREQGDPGGFENIQPPGQAGTVTSQQAPAAMNGQYPAHFNDQTAMYADLVDAAGFPGGDDTASALLGVSDGDSQTYYKDGSFGFAGEVERSYSPGNRSDLTVIRDKAFGVPHIYGDTREGAMFGAGYTAAEDRLFLMDVLRHYGRARLSEFLGASDSNKAMDQAQLRAAAYTEQDLSDQIDDICALGEEGARACDDVEAYSAGVTQFINEVRNNPSRLPAEYPALQQQPTAWIPEDVVAIASLVGGIFGRGGGNEIANGRFLAQLQEQYSPTEARAIFDDFRSANDPDAVTTIDEAFPYNNRDAGDLDPGALAILDLETVEATMAQMAVPELVADGPLGPINLDGVLEQRGMSNAILASDDVADGEVPIAVFGPQTGYTTPQLLVEMDIHGPGIDARGSAFAGTNIYVQLGRGRDYAWSATSAGGDNVDHWVLQLCNTNGTPATADSQAYVYDGACTPMEVYTHRQVAKPSAGGLPDPSAEAVIFDTEVERTVYGPVQGRGTLDGKPVAIAEERSTYGAELKSAIGFQRINDPDYMTQGAQSFTTAFDGVDYTFNWFYVDAQDIAYKHSCLCPIRDPRTDPDLPIIGNGEYDWTGQFLAPRDQPQAINPPSGFFANWNNKQAPEFRSNDANFNYSSTYRSEFLRQRMLRQIEGRGALSRADMVNIMTDAGTADLNASFVYPLMLEMIDAAGSDDDPPPPEPVARMINLLRDWVTDGGHRRDADDDGTYEHAVAISIGDVLTGPLLDAVFGDELGDADLPQRLEDHPRESLGSAFNGGQMNFLHKDFNQLLHPEQVQGPRSRTYCGQGQIPACRDAIIAAFEEAAGILSSDKPDNQDDECLGNPDEYRFGTDDVSRWVYDMDCDSIVQRAIGLTAAPDMEWINRPTFQQVVQVGSRIGRLSGDNRLFTAAAVSRQGFRDGAATVVLAGAGAFPDALSGTPLAVDREGPLLLTEQQALSPVTAREIERLAAEEVIILGGEAVVSSQIDADLAALGVRVLRLGGSNRFDTSRLVAQELDANAPSVIVASGEGFADALAAGPLAGVTRQPILLVQRNAVPPETADALQGVTAVRIAGGALAVSPGVTQALQDGGATVTRTGGLDRYQTGRLFTDLALDEGLDPAQLYVVTGTDFPDALSAGAAATTVGGVLLLTAPNGLDDAPPAEDFIEDNAPEILRLWLVGGQRALTSDLRADLETGLGPDPVTLG